MRTAEVVILLTIALVAAAAFALESLGPDAVRIIAIVFCCLLLVLVAVGMVVRLRMKRARAAGIEDPPAPLEGPPPP